MVLQTFLLLDLRFKGKGLGVVALIRIKSASKLYYIEIINNIVRTSLSAQPLFGHRFLATICATYYCYQVVQHIRKVVTPVLMIIIIF